MKTLSEKQAQKCEDAKEPICKCRCGGQLHGAKRGSVTSLAYGDPHSLIKPCTKCNGTGKRKYLDRFGVIEYDCNCNKGLIYPILPGFPVKP